jgi:NAD(P)-dependent dehydrogenase (short-subunit alcohol dehydrogenase family)
MGMVEDLQHLVEDQFGSTSILVNAAGVYGPVTEIGRSDPTAWINTVMVNAIGPYLTCRAFVRGMVDKGWGRIINVSSAASLRDPTPLSSAYGTAKVALNRMTRHLAAEIAGTGVTANLIHPGSLKTDMWADIGRQIRDGDLQVSPLAGWVDLVGRTGGDSLPAAVQLVLLLIERRSDNVNGQFCWPEGGYEPQVASW